MKKETSSLLKLALVFGGKSVEHDISILSALQVYHALDKTKYEVIPIYVTKENEVLISPSFNDLKAFQQETFKVPKRIFFYKENNKVLYQEMGKKHPIGNIDIAFMVLHGAGCEDGKFASICELLDLPYTSSDVTSSAICQDKVLTKEFLKQHGFKSLPYLTLDRKTYLHQHLSLIIEEIPLPLIVKPVNLGSSIGVGYATTKEELSIAISNAFRYSQTLIIEKALTNYREFNQAYFTFMTEEIPSAIEEVTSNENILSFIDKYEQDLNKLNATSNHLIPAVISDELNEEINQTTKKAYKTLSLKGVVRIDYLYDQDTNQLYLNEINTIPGSLSFYLYEPLGISFRDLLDKLIKNALFINKTNHRYLTNFKSSVLNKKSSKLQK